MVEITPEQKKRILELNAKGLSIFYIAQKLNLHYWDIQRILEYEIKKDFETLFED